MLSLLPIKLFGKLYLSLALSTIGLIWGVVLLAEVAQRQANQLPIESQKILQAYAQQAEALFLSGDKVAIKNWIAQVKSKENTWLGIAKITSEDFVTAKKMSPFLEPNSTFISMNQFPHAAMGLQGIQTPVLRFPLANSEFDLYIQVPQRLRPSALWKIFDFVIKFGLPAIVIALLSFILYRHLIEPIRALQSATKQFSHGDYQVRTADSLHQRNDEFSDLARTFDAMVARIGELVQRQRQLIQDISHELRTPITRIKLAMNSQDTAKINERIEQEIEGMQDLLEDTLTLSWLDNEATELAQEDVDLVLLIDAIADDASFEFPDHRLELDLPESCMLYNSNHRALGQAIENILRNAMKYSPIHSTVGVSLKPAESINGLDAVAIRIYDQGPGVDTQYLEEIFEPFFRVSQARDKATGGHGLGLALSKRQVEALGGNISAKLNQPTGLIFEMRLLLDAALFLTRAPNQENKSLSLDTLPRL